MKKIKLKKWTHKQSILGMLIYKNLILESIQSGNNDLMGLYWNKMI